MLRKTRFISTALDRTDVKRQMRDSLKLELVEWNEYLDQENNDAGCIGWPMACPCCDCSDMRDYNLGFTEREVAEAERWIGIDIKGRDTQPRLVYATFGLGNEK